MTPDTLRRAIEASRRFTKLAEQLLVRSDYAIKNYGRVESGKLAAECKRASLDLTSRLAEMRQR